MREFSQFERDFITSRLLTENSFNPGMFSQKFQNEVTLFFNFEPGKSTRIEMLSDSWTGPEINKELVNAIALLVYLNDNGLIRGYPPVATSLMDFEVVQRIRIGISDSTNGITYISKDAEYISDFVKKYNSFTFEATEPLRTLVANNFQTLEERLQQAAIEQARTANSHARKANLIAAILAITSIAVSWWQLRIAQKTTDIAQETLQETKIFNQKTADIQQQNLVQQQEQDKIQAKKDSATFVLQESQLKENQRAFQIANEPYLQITPELNEVASEKYMSFLFHVSNLGNYPVKVTTSKVVFTNPYNSEIRNDRITFDSTETRNVYLIKGTPYTLTVLDAKKLSKREFEEYEAGKRYILLFGFLKYQNLVTGQRKIYYFKFRIINGHLELILNDNQYLN